MNNKNGMMMLPRIELGTFSVKDFGMPKGQFFLNSLIPILFSKPFTLLYASTCLSLSSFSMKNFLKEKAFPWPFACKQKYQVVLVI